MPAPIMKVSHRPTIARSNPRWGVVLILVFLGIASCWQSQVHAAIDEPDRPLPPFLDVFRANQQPPVVTRAVTIPSVIGDVPAVLARPETKERLPAVMLIPGREGLTEWMKENARDLAGIGYVVLIPDLHSKQADPSGQVMKRAKTDSEERTLAVLSASVRWLRRRADVLPYRIGVVGWGRGGSQALELASSIPVQACVICDGEPPSDAAILAGLRHTAVLGIFAIKERAAAKSIIAWEHALADKGIAHRIKTYEGVGAGFMGSAGQPAFAPEAADRAYVEIYEFLGKYVEDAPEKLLEASSKNGSEDNSRLTIADIMLAVNAPEGVRGALMKSLEPEPMTQAQWDRV